MSKALDEKHKRCQAVVQIFPGGHTVVYKYVTDAWRITGINIRNIILCCENINKTAGGYRWRYANERY